MKKTLGVVCIMVLLLMGTSMIFARGAQEEEEEPLKIGYFVSTLDNAFHQSHSVWAQRYAMEEYGAEVQVFDGRSDVTAMAENFDQAYAQGMDLVSLHIWQGESIRPTALEALEDGMVITTYFDEIPDLPVPHIMPGEAEISYQMGQIAAEQWMKAHPDKPVVFVQIGWPDHEGVTMGRTDPFYEGVMDAAPDAEYIGIMDASRGADQAFEVTQDLIQARPDINIIYSQADNLTVGTLPALQQMGRGVMEDGVPLTEILISVDCPWTELVEIFDPTSSLKMSMGLPPKETAIARVDLMMDVYEGRVDQLDENAETIFVPNSLIGYWTQDSVEEAVAWYNEQFGENEEVPVY